MTYANAYATFLHFFCILQPMGLFLNPLVLLDGLGRDGGCGLGAVAHLRVGSSRANRAPCLAGRHAKRYRTRGEKR